MLRRNARGKAEKGLAKALVKRGVAAEAMIAAMAETGETRADGVAREIEFELRFAPADAAPTEVTVRQFMNEITLTGLAPGEPVEILYDREDPSLVMAEWDPDDVFRATGHVRPAAAAQAS